MSYKIPMLRLRRHCWSCFDIHISTYMNNVPDTCFNVLPPRSVFINWLFYRLINVQQRNLNIWNFLTVTLFQPIFKKFNNRVMGVYCSWWLCGNSFRVLHKQTDFYELLINKCVIHLQLLLENDLRSSNIESIFYLSTATSASPSLIKLPRSPTTQICKYSKLLSSQTELIDIRSDFAQAFMMSSGGRGIRLPHVEILSLILHPTK